MSLYYAVKKAAHILVDRTYVLDSLTGSRNRYTLVNHARAASINREAINNSTPAAVVQ